jgi:D-alanyl-D-alanine carboxypeptidase
MFQAMPGVEATLARISQLQTRFTGVAPTTAGRSAATTGTTAAGTTGTTFAAALASASGTAAPATAATALTPARRLPAGQYGALQAPAELAAYGNGRIPTDRLASIGSGHKLWSPAASAFTQMTAAAKRDGVTIGINDSYRDLAGQQRMAAQKGLYSQGGLAAEPGTSTHGWGVSTDLELDGKAQAWMRQNATDYGFVEDVAREPWHWTYRPAAG